MSCTYVAYSEFHTSIVHRFLAYFQLIIEANVHSWVLLINILINFLVRMLQCKIEKQNLLLLCTVF